MSEWYVKGSGGFWGWVCRIRFIWWESFNISLKGIRPQLTAHFIHTACMSVYSPELYLLIHTHTHTHAAVCAECMHVFNVLLNWNIGLEFLQII